MSSVVNMEELETMRYADLQKLAKKFGIKANMKSDKLIKSLRGHYEKVIAIDSRNQPDTGEKSLAEKLHATPKNLTPHRFILGKSTPHRKSLLASKLAAPNSLGKVRIPQSAVTPVGKMAGRASAGKMTPGALKRARSLSPEKQGSAKRSRLSKVSGESPRTRRTSGRKSGGTVQGETPRANGKPALRRTSGRKSGETVQGETPRTNGKPSSKRTSGRKSGEIVEGETPTANGKPASRRTSGRKSGESRRRTFELDEPSSPGVKVLLESMKDNMTSEEMKNSLMKVIDKNVQEKKANSSYQIPRFAAYVMKKKAEEEKAKKKPITPGNKDWAKIHQRQFDKMQGIDEYLARKRKLNEAVSDSVKKANQVAEETHSVIENWNKCKTSPTAFKSVGKPTSKARSMLFQSPHTGVPFVAKVTPASKMDTNLGDLKTPDRSQVPSMLTGPKSGRGGTATAASSKENKGRQSLGSLSESRKSGLETKHACVTPFQFVAHTNQNTSSMKKPKFDLKASLSRPLTWKPYKGKLEPLDPKNPHRKDVKQVKVTTKEERRKLAQKHRADKRFMHSQMRRKDMVE